LQPDSPIHHPLTPPVHENESHTEKNPINGFDRPLLFWIHYPITKQPDTDPKSKQNN
jgi:hypothetical protein